MNQAINPQIIITHNLVYGSISVRSLILSWAVAAGSCASARTPIIPFCHITAKHHTALDVSWWRRVEHLDLHLKKHGEKNLEIVEIKPELKRKGLAFFGRNLKRFRVSHLAADFLFHLSVSLPKKRLSWICYRTIRVTDVCEGVSIQQKEERDWGDGLVQSFNWGQTKPREFPWGLLPPTVNLISRAKSCERQTDLLAVLVTVVTMKHTHDEVCQLL